jgi:integrase
MPGKKRKKEVVYLSEKEPTATGVRSLYLQYLIPDEKNPGKNKVKKQYLKGLFLHPERTPAEKRANKSHNNNVIITAEAIKAERTRELLEGKAGVKRAYKTNLLLSDWMQHCADRAKERSASVANRHSWGRIIENTADLLKRYGGEAVRLSDVDKDFLLGFIEFLRTGYVIGRHVQNTGKHLAPCTANKRYQCLRFALSEAQREGIIAANPCDMVADADKIKVPESTRCYLTIEELKRLEATPTASDGTRAAYLFMAYCGLRISDVKGLRWEDLNTSGEPWTITIRQQKTQKPLYLPLSIKAREFLPQQGEKEPSDLIFADLPTEPAMNRTLKKWATRAGITKNVTLHTARHTYATTLLTKGADLYTVSKLLGHSEVATTQIYAKIVDSKKVEAVNLLNNL